MCRRSQEPAIGQWVLPSGFLECGETLEQGAARETFEETGVSLDPNQLDLASIINITAIDQVIQLSSQDVLVCRGRGLQSDASRLTIG